MNKDQITGHALETLTDFLQYAQNAGTLTDLRRKTWKKGMAASLRGHPHIVSASKSVSRVLS